MLVCYTVFFWRNALWEGALRDDTKNGCVADHLYTAIFKDQIMAENTENNKQFELEEEDLKMIRKTSDVNTHRSSIVGDKVHVDFVASSH